MTDEQIQEITDQFIHALEGMARREPSWLTFVSAATSFGALTAVLVVFGLGTWSLNQQQKALSTGALGGVTDLEREGGTHARSEWWERALWALEATASTSDARYTYGTAILGILAKSNSVSSEEKALFDVVWQASCTRMQDREIDLLLKAYLDASPRKKTGSQTECTSTPGVDRADAESHQPESEPAGSTEAGDADDRDQMLGALRREILAARLKVTLDEQLGRETSAAVKLLAGMKLLSHRH